MVILLTEKKNYIVIQAKYVPIATVHINYKTVVFDPCVEKQVAITCMLSYYLENLMMKIREEYNRILFNLTLIFFFFQ